MNILLHTIALEPARWTPQKVSRPLPELLPTIAGAGFYKLEVYEPHLSLLPDEPAMVPIFAYHHLVPTVLSSGLELSPHLSADASFEKQAAQLFARVDRFGFRKVCLSPGTSPSPGAMEATAEAVTGRLRLLAAGRPEVEFLLETRAGSLADDPTRVTAMVESSACPNVGLAWQPTVFEPTAAWAQWHLQRPFVRHLHLQNRNGAGRICRLSAGIIPWGEILASSAFAHDVSLEFVPSGFCEEERFDLATSVQEAVEEFALIVKLES